MATRVLGLDRLKRKLRRMPLVARDEIAKSMEQTANEVVALAKSLTQSDRVRNSIAWTYGDAPEGTFALAGVRSSDGELKITIYAGSDDAFMARWEEFGTAPHVQGGMFAGTMHPGTPARPYFYVSWRAKRKQARSRMTRAINKAAKRVAAGG